jgi:replicative DNA helicase
MRDTPPPFSEDAEAAVLGAVLLHDSAFAEASEILPDASMFWAQKHRVIWRVLESMHEQGVPAGS